MLKKIKLREYISILCVQKVSWKERFFVVLYEKDKIMYLIFCILPRNLSFSQRQSKNYFFRKTLCHSHVMPDVHVQFCLQFLNILKRV